MFNFTNQEQLTILRALSFYGKDLAENDVDTNIVLALICEVAHCVETES